jgi:molecular chaperone HscB
MTDDSSLSDEAGATEDPFDLLGLEPLFDLDLEKMRSRVRRRVAACHPDLCLDPFQQEESTRLSARLNQARELLESHEARANLLHARFGGPSAQLDGSLPPDFLMEILDIRMRLEEAIESRDEVELLALKTWAMDERARLKSEVALGLEQMSNGEDVGTVVRGHLNIWRYIERMLSQLEPTIGGGLAS